jgi:hypothetical protein
MEEQVAMEQFWEDLDSGEIHIRDKWQFELKSEFSHQATLKSDQYTQEFFFFIPSALQINKQTYSKTQFYRDQTNLIRYKTPMFSFPELLDPQNSRSPLTRILTLCDQPSNEENRTTLADELKLFANVVRSALRTEIRQLIQGLQPKNIEDHMQESIDSIRQLCLEWKRLRIMYAEAQEKFLEKWRDPLLYKHFLYIDEFISNAVNHYLTGLIENIRLLRKSEFTSTDKLICETLIDEKKRREVYKTQLKNSNHPGKGEVKNEYFLYRNSLLNKFVLNALMLTTNRFSIDERYQNWIGSLSAGIAMTLYFCLFIWLGTIFIINSLPFILFTIITYVLKDRLKEILKLLSYQQAFRWFSDYTTEIRTFDQKHTFGQIKESFSFLEEEQLPPAIRETRNKDFHAVLETFQRPENVLYYKRTVEMRHSPSPKKARRYGVSIIFRFNIHRFLRNASDPYESYVTIDPKTSKLVTKNLPKVYHLNLLMKNTSLEEGLPEKVELKKLRLIIDKNGIKRIEQV